ncbi:hypothetical protein M5D96_000759 [Drosophila gunungcola]|uniref:Uncharacterized protein n=1 Tax=Drosophila gunungcola TaxID=103775 RepID=A0A9P9YWT4_9MUSC|nr:hypothetical protein M5D96_000759 [Drosophila gunungcola]
MSQSTERRTMIQEKRKLMEDKRMNMGMKSFCASFIGTNFRPSDDPRNSFSSMMRRHIADKQFVDASYEANDEEVFEPIYQTEFDDDRDLKLEPTFSKHRIPLTMAYTSLWPPLHTRKELKMFEKDFCKLSPTEQRRFNKIMATDFS